MRILIIEDEQIIARSLKTGFVDEGFAVDVLYNGKEGYEQASVEEYDLIILDIMLPEMDGKAICKKLRTEKIKTPILMLTAKDTIQDKIEGLDLGADDYMVKPFSFEELLSRVRAIIRRANINEIVLNVDNLELNPQTHIVKRKGKTIDLTGKEYSLLEYLMYHKNQIITREQILSHVWDYSYEGMSNIIEVIVRRLRNKIDKAFSNEKKLISTIRGLGYKIGE